MKNLDKTISINQLKLVFLFLFFSNLNTFAQIDSLENILKLAKEDTNRVTILNELCREYVYSNPQKALQYGKQGLVLAEQLGFKKGIANSLNIIGIVHSVLGNYAKTLDYYFQSLKKHEELEDKQGIAGCFIGIGSIYWYQRDYENAEDYYLQALKMYEKLGYKQGIASSLSGVGVVYGAQGKMGKAVDYYMQSLKMFKKGIIIFCIFQFEF